MNQQVEKLVNSATELRREKHISYEKFLKICNLQESEMLSLEEREVVFNLKNRSPSTKIGIIKKLEEGLVELEKLVEPTEDFTSIENIFKEYRNEIPCAFIGLNRDGHIECEVHKETGDLSNFIKDFLQKKGYEGDVPEIKMYYFEML